MSETVQRTAAAAGGPQGRQAGPGGGPGVLLWRGLRVFARQREATVFVVAAVLFIAFAVGKGSSFTSQSNLATLFSDTAAPIVIVALGEVLLLICGEIDLSVGFVIMFGPYFMYFMINLGVPGILAIVLTLVLGLAIGWVNGFFTVTVGMPSFITTLGTGFLLWGITLTTSHDQPASIPQNVQGITGKVFANYPWAQIIWAAALTVVFHILLTRTRWGLHTVSVGGNLLGAREAGIHVNRIKYGNFMLTGLLGALVGLQTMYYSSAIDPTNGGYNPMFYAVTAAVIGGTAMLGGSGTVIGAFLGAMALGILLDGFPIIGVSANTLYIVFGAAIIIAMIANVQLARLRERGQR